ARPLKHEVERRGSAERGKERVRGKCAGSHLHKALGELEGFASLIFVETKNKIRLHVGDESENHVHVFRDPLHLLQSDGLSGLGLVAAGEPGLDSGKNGSKSAALEAA